MNKYDTNSKYTPWEQLPIKEPRYDPPDRYAFYECTAKHLIKDTVRIMSNGVPIDLKRVRELEHTLDKVLDEVDKELQSNTLMKEFQEHAHKHKVDAYIEEQKAKTKSAKDFVVVFKYNKMEHRSYFMYLYGKANDISQPLELLPSGVPKWTARMVKKLAKSRPILQAFVEGKLTASNNKFVREAVNEIAKDKARIHNKRYEDRITEPEIEFTAFNPGSSKQKAALFDYLKIKSDKISKTTGEPSFDRKQLERILSETLNEDLKVLLRKLIDFSYGAIIKNNFVKNFYRYTIDGRLYGQYVLFGAKSFRYTSKAPNMLNQPSSGSVYAGPVKRCFIAPEGYVIYAIDFGALEDRIIASLSKDTNKCNIFLSNLDGHCLNAYGYFKEEVAEHMELTGNTDTDVKNFYELYENGNKKLKEIRSKGKPATLTSKRLHTVMYVE